VFGDCCCGHCSAEISKHVRFVDMQICFSGVLGIGLMKLREMCKLSMLSIISSEVTNIMRAGAVDKGV